MEKVKIKNAIVSYYGQNTSENFHKFIKLAKDKNINVITVEAGDRAIIDDDVYFDILWPGKKDYITENEVNNNAIVCKLNYKNFSMLFTGDVEKETEEILCTEYRNKLKSTILKAGHHGSNTSSTENFIKLVSAKYVFIRSWNR